jgi:hypothetical protein
MVLGGFVLGGFGGGRRVGIRGRGGGGSISVPPRGLDGNLLCVGLRFCEVYR